MIETWTMCMVQPGKMKEIAEKTGNLQEGCKCSVGNKMERYGQIKELSPYTTVGKDKVYMKLDSS